MSDGVQNLHNAIKAAAGAPFALDADFLATGLDDPEVTVPADYDSWLESAFFSAQAADFRITVNADDVGPVDNDSFTVENATVPFVGSQAPLASKATLVFARDGSTLVVQIHTVPENWTWTSSFAFMGGYPFNQLDVLNAEFIFSTVAGHYPFGDDSGKAVAGGAKQNFFAELPLPDVVRPFLALFEGLTAPTAALSLSGAFDMAGYNAETALLPPATLNATIRDGSFQLLYLTVRDPSVSVTIPALGGPDDSDVDDDDDSGQAPLLSIASGIHIGSAGDGDESPYILQVQIVPGANSDSGGLSNSGENIYDIGLVATGEGPPLSPSAIIELVGGGGSYFAATPAVLQQFLAFVSLQGLSLSGPLADPLNITSVAVEIGSSPDTTWTILPDPTGKLDFTIRSFTLQWSLQYPFDSAQRQQSYDFTTEFTLAPDVFKGPGGQGDGVFTVQFTSDSQFFASFDGTAELSDFLATLTNGAVTIADTIQAQLADVRLAIDYSSQSFAFSSGYSVAVNFLTVGGAPVLSISEGEVKIAARTPTQSEGGGSNITGLMRSPVDSETTALMRSRVAQNAASNTDWQASIGGMLAVGPLQADVSIAYDGFATPARWDLDAGLAETFKVSELINQFFDPGGNYPFPSFLLGDLELLTFSVKAQIPAGAGDLKTSYDIATWFRWLFQFGDQEVGIDPAKLGLSYDGSKPQGQQFSGFAEGVWVYPAINLALTMGYQFQPTAAGGNQILFVEWEGFRAQWESGQEQIIFSLKGWSIGTLVQALVRTLGNPYFTLGSPWDLLNQISLDGLKVMVSLKSGASFSQRLAAEYTLSSPINLGFVSINGLIFRRDTSGKVTLAIEGSSPLAGSDPAFADLMNPDKGQDVDNLPSVPGRGEEWFKLFLLVLGQRIGITGFSEFENTKAVICALKDVPNTTGALNPVDPNADQGSQTGLPYYNQRNSWLIAGHLGLLKVGNAWSIDAMVVFNDPDLYGLRLALAGAKVGGLANLVIDILYKKISDDIGVYQIEFSFPDAIRNLNFGAVSITLPQIGIKVFTNGDFFIDIGFPYNLDFRRSFSIAAIVYGVPVLGSGGFYFGKLSNATSTQVPTTDLGTFDPVIEFGIGLQLGLGYNFEKGPLKAGFALTVFGIIEGVIAPWHPYDNTATALARTASGALQSDYFFKLRGTVGVIGLLYGTVDFAIISAAVNVRITLSLQITYQSYREIPIVATATVDISLRVKIDLGLFSVSIKLSFSAKVSASFIIGANQTAPWEVSSGAAIDRLFAPVPAAEGRGGPDAAVRYARRIRPNPKRLRRGAGSKPTLSLMAAAQFTVAAPEGSTSAAANRGAFVFMLTMDAPDPTGASATSNTSFDQLAQVYFSWLIDLLANPSGTEVDIDKLLADTVSAAQLERWITRLADNQDKALTIRDVLQFLADGFVLNIQNPTTAQQSGLKDKLDQGALVFPPFDGLSLTIPDPDGGSGTKSIDFERYTTATPSYARTVTDMFAEVAARIEAENQEDSTSLATVADTPESMAALMFVDAFAMIGRQLLQAAANALQSYPYRLAATTTIDGILSALQAAGNPDLGIGDVVAPNADHALRAALGIEIAGLQYTIQSGDTLAAIAAVYSDSSATRRWTTSAAQLIVTNAAQRILAGGVALKLTGKDGPVEYTTRVGDTFGDIAAELDIGIDGLAAQSVLYNVDDLLVPTQRLDIATINYQTAGSSGASTDSLRSVAARFQTTVVALAAANDKVPGLFSTDAEGGILTVANLSALSVSALWDAIAATDQVSQTAGMVSRFLMYGLRLPTAAGLALSDEFLYPTGQSAYGAYQLTGQQFPVPTTASDYLLRLERASSAHGVNLDFVEFDKGVDKTLPIDLSSAYERLNIVVDWARTPGNFAPAPELTVLPLADRTPRVFATSSAALWSSAAMAALEQLTDRSAAVAMAAQDGDQAQVQPSLWALPPGLTDLIDSRQSRIEAAMGSIAHSLPLLPQFVPQVGRTNPADGQTAYTDLDNWAWCTRVDFEIKRLPAVPAIAAQGTGAGSLPQGPASAPSLPNSYELVGPSAADALRLARILSAMDELGEDIVSGMFLLYNQSGPGAPMLVTPGDDDFLAFITQTNLATETNPARSQLLARARQDGQPPRGIANAPGEFIKLMWELSTVRSGGYYLFYELAESGAGLPASVFDSAGTGTLSMVVTFAAAGPSSFGNTVPDFVTSFVTTDNLDTSRDVTQLCSIAASGTSAPLQGSESLADVAAIYGPGPGRIAEVNADRAVRAGAELPIAGIVHQLVEGDLVRNNGNIDADATRNQLAARFSAGAKVPISGQDIADFNPGVSVELAAVFYIPPVTYEVGAAAPGNTFRSMAAYYGVSIDELVRTVFAVAGVFPANDTLSIDSQLFDLRAQLPARNLGISLRRVNLGEPPVLPDNPTDAEKAAYARATMFALYTSLAAGLAANTYFNPSPMGLPFGPQDHGQGDDARVADGDDAQCAATFASAARSLERRRRRLVALAEEDFAYRQSIGIGDGFAKINAAPKSTVPGLPKQSANPYIGVGSGAQVSLRWQDLFGNTTVTPFTVPPQGYTGALNGSLATVLYSDRLIGLGDWPNVRASYIYVNPEQPALQLDLALDSAAYQGDEGRARAQNDLSLYQRVYFQLHQDYDQLDEVTIPGVSGNAVSMALSNSLLAAPVTELGRQEAAVRDFVSASVVYLDGIVKGSAPPPPTAQILLPVNPGALAAGNIIELDVALILRRNPLLTDPLVAALEGGLSVSAAVLPQADSDAGVAYTRFAAAVAEVFQNDDWFLEVGAGLSRAGGSRAGAAQQLWAVRFGKQAGQGIYFTIGDSPSYYAPKPLAKALESRRVTITNYRTGENETIDFDGVDVNLWFQTMLDAIDSFLSADYAPHAFILDKLDGVDDPLDNGNLGQVLATKESLADSISSTLLPVLSTSASDEATAFAAAEKFRQQVLNQIGAAYRTGVTAVYGLSEVSGGETGPAGPPNLYGQPVGSIQGQATNQNYSLTPARIPLAPVADDGTTFAPRLAFVFTSKNLLEQAYVPLDLALKISHLEFDRRSVPGIEGYVESRWLAFVNGPFSYQLGGSTANLPVVERNLPTPPTVSSQVAERSDANPSEPSQLAQWDYSFQYLYQQAASDAVSYTIELNRVKDAGSAQTILADEPDLFAALAQFITSYPEVLSDLNTYLVPIDAQEPDGDTLAKARQATAAFAAQTAAVARAYADSLKANTGAVQALPRRVIIDFLSALDQTAEGHARTDIFGLQIDRRPATWNEDDNTISNGDITLPAMVVAIEPATYAATAVPAGELLPGVDLAYLYQVPAAAAAGAVEPGQFLSYSDAQKVAARTVSMDHLDVLAYQSAWASIFVQRNRILFPIADIERVSTKNDFLFQTPTVRFADPIVPRLVYERFSLDDMQGAAGDLAARLKTFFNGLYSGGNGTTEVEVAMQGAYSYSIAPTVADIPRVLLPINLLPPAPSVVTPKDEPAFVAPFAQTIADWQQSGQPTRNGDPQIDIELKVFGATAAKQPLISVQRLIHEVNDED